MKLTGAAPLGLETPADLKAGNTADSKGARATTAAQAKLAKATEVAQEFESMFFGMVLKSMRATAKPEEASNAQDIYQDMLDGEYSKNMAGQGSLGIGQMILEWMKTSDATLQPDSRAQAKAALDSYGAMSSIKLMPK